MSETKPIRRDPVIEAYKKDIDRTLLRENLRLSPEQRLEEFQKFQRLAGEMKAAGEELRRRQGSRGDE